MVYDTEKLEWIAFDLLEQYPHVMHGVFLRHGGVSEGPFASLNVADGIGDNPEHVKVNRELIRKRMGVSRLVFPCQSHGTNIERVNGKNQDRVLHADALFTTEKNVGIAVSHADCQATLFYDPVHEAIAVVHAGWRGSAQNIYARTIETLGREVGSQPHNLLVCISPSLGSDHFEFKHYKQQLPQEFWQFMTQPNYFDFWAISQKQLLDCGVLEKNIEISGVCTVCHPEDYFSYRREKETGRHATVIALKP